MSPPDSALLARAIVSDDRTAFAELVRRHQSAVRLFLRQLTRGDSALADDLAQETFLRAYRRLRDFRGESQFSTWLLGIAHNFWRNARRGQREQVPFEEAGVDMLASPEFTSASDLRNDLARALRELSSDEQLAIHLAYQQGQSHAEIAALLDWPLGTVKTHLARAKDKLRNLLAAWNPQT